MDNLTHSLVGVMLARAGLNRRGAGMTTVVVIASNIPDSDVVAMAGGSLKYLEVHRGYTHALLGLPFMAVLSVLIASALFRRWIPLWTGTWIAAIGVAGHLFLDWTNSYGIRLLLPFSSRWFHLDWDSLIDRPLLVVLCLAFVWPFFARLVLSEIGGKRNAGGGSAWAAVVALVAVESVRAFTHARAIAQLNVALYEDKPAVNVAALPDGTSPWTWHTIVETDRAYEQGVLHLLTESEATTVRRFLKLPRDGAIEAARRTEPFRFLEYFARFPVWSEQPGSTTGPRTTRVELTDLRFGTPGAGSCHAVALVDAAGRSIESAFTWGDGEELGWSSDVRMKQR